MRRGIPRACLILITDNRWLGSWQPLKHVARFVALSTLAEERLPHYASGLPLHQVCSQLLISIPTGWSNNALTISNISCVATLTLGRLQIVSHEAGRTLRRSLVRWLNKGGNTRRCRDSECWVTVLKTQHFLKKLWKLICWRICPFWEKGDV